MLKMNDYLRISEAAEYLGIKVRTLRDWQANGKIRSFMHPNINRRLYLKSDLDEILKGVVTVSDVLSKEQIDAAVEFCDPENKLSLRK